MEFGKTYSAGDNISIYEQGEQLYISSKDWTNDIANASANAYNEAVAKIPDPFDPTFISASVDNKVDTTDFTKWIYIQYSPDLRKIEVQISNKLDSSSFSDVSGTFYPMENPSGFISKVDHLWSFYGSDYSAQPIVLCDAPQQYSATAPYFKAGPHGITAEINQKNNPIGLYGDFDKGIRYSNAIAKISATLDSYDVNYTKYNTTISANEIWSLTGSVQKREIEYDSDTSAITAIAGSAIGGVGGGVTGKFVPQSAFDELKASYDALSSLVATYSGQWLLPNEGA